MSNIMAQMLKMMQEISEVLSIRKKDMSDVHNLDHENPCTIDDHDEIYEMPIYFMAIAEKVQTDELEEFDSFSFDNCSKTRVTKALCNRRGRSSKQ
ncbi:hypothetical protein PVK06_048670 [Gossypium arboreum]|uniref:Uncharacterized protein n=1 Tax=Gossypium arboreum TaxID=29729 RepID=A0ABR0MIJ2_GOSAR|nr:hypothetical protein PVK06_048670 [Gossypium arboreum]